MPACEAVGCGRASARTAPVRRGTVRYAVLPHPTIIASLLLALLATPVFSQPEPRTLEHQGVARGYIVANAPAAKGDPRPVMLVLHGRRAADAPNRSSPALDELAAREGFVAVYPAGISGVWNWPTRVASADVPLAMAGVVPADDFGFLTRLVDALIADRVADPARVYVSGASMGGFMTFGLMCGMSDKIAAAAAMIASMTDKQVETCEPGRPVPLMMLAGTLDTLVPYEGRNQGGVRLLSIDEVFGFWARPRVCRHAVNDWVVEAPSSGRGAITTTFTKLLDCESGPGLRLYRVDGGGHTLPSRRPISEEERKRFGPRSTEFETSEEVWAFFKRFRL